MIGVAPTEGIALQFNTKVPGPTITIDGVEMKFRYKDYFKAEPSTGYETLIYDCMIGDNILFQRADSVEAGWKAVQPFLDAWAESGGRVEGYAAGSDGPKAAERLLQRDGRSWHTLTDDSVDEEGRMYPVCRIRPRSRRSCGASWSPESPRTDCGRRFA